MAPPREKDCLPRGEVLEPDLKRRAAREGCRGRHGVGHSGALRGLKRQDGDGGLGLTF